MEIIRYKNRVNAWEHIILFIMALDILLSVYSHPILFCSACTILLFVHVFLTFRMINISIDKNFMTIGFTILKIPYRKISVSFDKVSVSSCILDPIVFYKGADKILEFAYEDDVTSAGVEKGTMEIRHSGKAISTDNEKTSYELFLKIKEVVLRQT